jgi:calcineurin-like phosphoesterase family protein
VVLGDVFWDRYKYIEKIWKDVLHGTKILIKGNHDQWIKKLKPVHYDIYHKYVKLKGGRKRHFVGCHYPMLTWPHRKAGAIHVHGHSHGKRLPEQGRIDVGVDVAKIMFGEWRPFRAEEIEYLIKGRKR